MSGAGVGGDQGPGRLWSWLWGRFGGLCVLGLLQVSRDKAGLGRLPPPLPLGLRLSLRPPSLVPSASPHPWKGIHSRLEATTSIPGLQHYQVGISDWRGSRVEGTRIGKQGREAHSKFMTWRSSTNRLTFHLCEQFPQILTYFFLVFPFILLMKNKKTHFNLRAQNVFLPLPQASICPHLFEASCHAHHV